MKNKPKISIIIPTWNGSKYIERALNSVFSQTFQDFEIIIVDDGSTDNMVYILDKYIKENKVIYLKQENQGPGPARKNGVAHSEGEYIAFIDDDDIWSDNNKLKEQVEFLDNNPDHVMVGTAGVIYYEIDNEYRDYNVLINDDDIRRRMLSGSNFIQSSVMVRRSVLGDLSIMPIVSKDIAEDYLLWLRLGLIGKMANIPKKMVIYTNRKGSITDENRDKVLKNNMKIISKYRNNYPNYYKYIIFYVFKYFVYCILSLIKNERLKNKILKPLLIVHRKIISK